MGGRLGGLSRVSIFYQPAWVFWILFCIAYVMPLTPTYCVNENFIFKFNNTAPKDGPYKYT